MKIVSTLHQHLAVFYVYLIATAWAETLAPEVRSLFGKTLQFDGAGKPIVQDIVKSTEHRLEVSNFLQNAKGEWHEVRSLGGSIAMKWIELHGQGHPNTTVRWSNGTHVERHETSHLLKLTKRWGWGDTAIELLLWGTSAGRITNAGLAMGFGAAVAATIIKFAYAWLSSGKADASTVQSGNNKKRGALAARSNFEPNVYFHQKVGNQANTGHWPAGQDMQNAAHSAMQDMTDHDYQRACYDAVTDETHGPNAGCPVQEFAQVAFCSWPDGGSCTTPSCQLTIGEFVQCTGSRAADGQYGRK